LLACILAASWVISAPAQNSTWYKVFMARPLVVGNWKMHGTASSIDPLLAAITSERSDAVDADYAVCPPNVYISLAKDRLALTTIKVGAQNVALEDEGAFTGEVSASMLADIGCDYVIVGHSERRALFGESSSLVAHKAGKVIAKGMTPIVCVGESLQDREAGNTLAIVKQQLDAVLTENREDLASMVLAYEPVWAIGTGLTATPEQAQAVHKYLRECVAKVDEAVAVSIKILYGGSVKPSNSASLFGQKDIDGALVGGASLVAEDFIAIGKIG
jgi:triosephosphate isomerase